VQLKLTSFLHFVLGLLKENEVKQAVSGFEENLWLAVADTDRKT
jgi:hypothetical protein